MSPIVVSIPAAGEPKPDALAGREVSRRASGASASSAFLAVALATTTIVAVTTATPARAGEGLGAGGEGVRTKVLNADGSFRAAVASAVDATDAAAFEGKLERALADHLRQRAAEPVDVVYMVRGPVAPVARTDLDSVAEAVAAAQQGIVVDLQQRGQRVKYRARYAPIVVASGDGASVRAMEARSDVERIFLERTHSARLNITKTSGVTQAVTVHGRGINGAGVRVGVVEPGRVGAHANLPGSRRVLCGSLGTTFVNTHKTQVAGVIQSNNATHRGQAPQITLVDAIGANFSDPEMMAATDCAITNGAVALNMSFGSDTDGAFNAFARFVDATVYNTGRTIAVAVSNDCSLRMGSPEIAFNDLSVGSFSDGNTSGGSNDRHSCVTTLPHSAFLDPPSPSGDREQPDIVAPGHLVRTTVPGGGFADATGTSFAAPHATGLAGLLQNRSATFSSQAERLRAIIMASARKNIEGAAVLSERDGAGAQRDAAADRVLLNAQSFSFSRPGGTTGFPIDQTFTANAGQVVRVVAVWAHKSPGGDTLTGPTTDLDLSVFAPGGAVVGGSSSFDNTFEITQFTAPATGTYTARITNFRSSPGSEFIGLAVSRANS